MLENTGYQGLRRISRGKETRQGQTGNTPHPEAAKSYREESLLSGVIRKVDIDALRKGVTEQIRLS